MIFMSESGLIDTSRESEWDRWYIEHLKIMASVPGISSAQRFKSTSGGASPSLAVYSVASAEVFNDPYYLSVRGMGEWLPLINTRYYQRNLFAGLAHAPRVSDSQRLLVADRDTQEARLGGADWVWLECVGIDRSTPLRGISVVESHTADALRCGGVAIYAPDSGRYAAVEQPKRP
jgi:hypothetical protein